VASYPPSPFPVDYSADPCNDCGALPGEPHGDGCDVARCLFTGGQRLVCGSLGFLGIETPAHDDCGDQVWTGVWPGEAECREFGWYSLFVPPAAGEQYGQWVRCDKDTPGAGPNLNRLAEDARWDRGRQRWVLRSTPAPEIILVAADKTCNAYPCQWNATDASGGSWYLRYEGSRGSMGREPLDVRLSFTGASDPEVITIAEFCERVGVAWVPEEATSA
jgi:hypothetical protein